MVSGRRLKPIARVLIQVPEIKRKTEKAEGLFLCFVLVLVF